MPVEEVPPEVDAAGVPGDPLPDDPEPEASFAGPSLLEPEESLFEPGVSWPEPPETLLEPPESLLEPAESLLEPPESLLEPAESVLEPAESLPCPSVGEVALALDDDRSFFAQPDPLKWIEGAEKALRTGAAPQTGQTVGPSAVTPWITSDRWSFGQR
ncbi:MAG TPA: hypothetical protein VM427_09660 [Patescibacteria group bacterium]|nr:hypothetical protein [Patescibacteria group bacterium]